MAKVYIKKGVDIGMRGWWEETTPNIIRINNSFIGHFKDEDLQRLIVLYAPFVVMWENNPQLITLHQADDDRLHFTNV